MGPERERARERSLTALPALSRAGGVPTGLGGTQCAANAAWGGRCWRDSACWSGCNINSECCGAARSPRERRRCHGRVMVHEAARPLLRRFNVKNGPLDECLSTPLAVHALLRRGGPVAAHGLHLRRRHEGGRHVRTAVPGVHLHLVLSLHAGAD